MPPLASGIEPISVREFTPKLRNAGGLYVTSGSVAMIAGYWSIASLGLQFLSYFGCDLVFPKDPNAATHYYGVGDTGPLVGNFQYNSRQRERSIRLLCWGLLHNVIVTNSSGLDGSLLACPKLPLHKESTELFEAILASKEAQRLLRKAGNILASEQMLRTPAFRERQRIFEKDPDALQAMHAMFDAWATLEPFVQEYADKVQELSVSISEDEVQAASAAQAPNINRMQSKFDLVLHIGSPNSASSMVRDTLTDEAPRLAKANCKVLSPEDVRSHYTKPAASFSEKSAADFPREQRNIKIAQNFSRRFFENLDVRAGDRVLIRDEGALGNSAQCAQQGKLYRSPSKFLNNFAANLPVEPSEVHVVILNYAAFFSWAYSEILNSGQKEGFISPNLMTAKVMANLPSWRSTLSGVRMCFPQSKVHVWCFDNMENDAPTFMKALTGHGFGQVDWQSRFAANKDFNQGGAQIGEFLDSIQRSGVEVSLEDWWVMKTNRNVTPSQFDPWHGAQKNHLDRLYHEDLCRIEEDDNFVLHRSA